MNQTSCFGFFSPKNFRLPTLWFKLSTPASSTLETTQSTSTPASRFLDIPEILNPKKEFSFILNI
jgi:hypothetical protein